MNKIAQFIKTKRKEAGLTQEEFAMRSGLGLRFVRELEQGKETVRMDKVNTALAMFNMEAVPGRKEGRQRWYSERLMFMSEIFLQEGFAKVTRDILLPMTRLISKAKMQVPFHLLCLLAKKHTVRKPCFPFLTA